MEAARSSRLPSMDGSEPEYDSRVRDAETVEKKPSSEQDTITDGESSTCQPPCSQEEDDIPGTSGAAPPSNVDNNDMETLLRTKINEGGLGNMTVPEMHMSGCSDCEETASEEEDDDLCSTSSDDTDDSHNFLPSGVLPPVLPDIQLRVPMENEDDVQRVKEALLIKGVLDVVCDERRQIVTVTGIVPPSRLLKKVRKVNRQARIVSTASPFALFINPHFGASSFGFHHEDEDEEDDDDAMPQSQSPAIDIPNLPSFAANQRPRPTFQRYNFHNNPHSPYLRTFNLSDLTPPASSSSPSEFSPSYVTGDAFDHHICFDSSFIHDDLII